VNGGATEVHRHIRMRFAEVELEESLKLAAELNIYAYDAYYGCSPLRAYTQSRLRRTCTGENSAWLFVMAFFGWREFRNRREVGALAGLTPTPHIEAGSTWSEIENDNPCSPHGHIDNREIGRIRLVGYLTLQEE
jgi:hypothetical protein